MDFKKLGHTAIVGLAWGDEGKGKVVDLVAGHFDVGVRFNGGANAGHTVRVGERTFKFHALPSTTLRPDRLSVIGPGVALDLPAVLEEIDALKAQQIAVGENLRISDRCHLVMPWHKAEDALSEASLEQGRRIGTTARGVGPCYADKMQRTTAFRVCDLYRREPFAEKVALVAARKRAVFEALYKDDSTELDAEDICTQFVEMGERIRPFVCDTTALLREAAMGGKRILYEGANGTLLDVDHGTYPYVTSSNASALGIHAGAGVHRGMVNTVIGVAKAYATRVGRGPFPTELHDDVGERIRERGREYGTTTGRPRRCGWFDAVAVRYSVELNGVDHVAIMHLDTLAGLKEIGVCVGYEDPGGGECGFGSDAADLAGVRPRYEFLPGWDRDIRNVRRTEELPDAARAFVGRLQELLGVPISMISVGPERDETIIES